MPSISRWTASLSALGAEAAGRLLDHGPQAYAAVRRVETPEDVAGLDVLREGELRP
jgi:hypothetical protein